MYSVDCFTTCKNECIYKSYKQIDDKLLKEEKCSDDCKFLKKEHNIYNNKLIDTLTEGSCLKIINEKVLHNIPLIENIEEQLLFIKINELKNEINQYMKDEHYFEKIFQKSKITSDNLKSFYKEIIKILQLTLSNIKKEYIPEPIIDIKKIKQEILDKYINDILNNIYYLIIYNKLLINNENLYLLLKDIINNKDKIEDKIQYYNYLSDIYIIIINDNDYNVKIKEILELPYKFDCITQSKNFIHIKQILNSIENNNIFNKMKYFIQNQEADIDYELSNYNYTNPYGSSCYFVSALQFLYVYPPFKKYIYSFKFSNTNILNNIIDNIYNSDKNDTYDLVKKLDNIYSTLPINELNNFIIYYKPILMIYIIQQLFKLMKTKRIDKPTEEKYIIVLLKLIQIKNDKSTKLEYQQDDAMECIEHIFNITLYENDMKLYKSISYELSNKKIINSVSEKINNNYRPILLVIDYIISIMKNKKYTDTDIFYAINNYDMLNKFIIDNKIHHINIMDLLKYLCKENKITDYKYNNIIPCNKIEKIQFSDSKYIMFNISNGFNNIIDSNDPNQNKKINLPIYIDNEINLNQYTIDKYKKTNKYRIKSIIIHNGISYNYGHYYIYVCDNVNDDKCKWYEYNNTYKSTSKTEIILNYEIENNKKYINISTNTQIEQIEENTPYILLYEKINDF